METKKPVKLMRSSELSELRYAKSAPQLSEPKMSPLALSGSDAESMEFLSKLIENIASPPYSQSPDAVPPQKRNTHGMIYDMSPSRPSSKDQLVQMLTAFHNINFSKPRR